MILVYVCRNEGDARDMFLLVYLLSNEWYDTRLVQWRQLLYVRELYLVTGKFHCFLIRTLIQKDNTGLQRNWGKHKNTRFYLIWGCCIQIWNPFLLITSSFLDMHSVHFVHIRYIKAYMNSGLILILWDLWLIFLVIMHYVSDSIIYIYI